MNLEKLKEYFKKYLIKDGKINSNLKKIIRIILKIILRIIGAYIVIQVILCIIVAIIMLSPLGDYDFKIFKDPSEYSEALSYACEEVGHFPKEIPAGAKNILLHKPNDCYSENFSLSFEIDRGYIDNELNRYNFVETEGPYSTDGEYGYNSERFYAVYNVNLNKAGFKFYVIGKNTKGEYGIAVNDKTNRILYYSILLD